MQVNYQAPFRACSTKLLEHEKPVQNNLAITPSEAYELAKNGMAVSTQNLNADNFFDGEPNPAPLPDYQRRGVDIGDVWEQSRSARKKVREAIKKSIQDTTTNQA